MSSERKLRIPMSVHIIQEKCQLIDIYLFVNECRYILNCLEAFLLFYRKKLRTSHCFRELDLKTSDFAPIGKEIYTIQYQPKVSKQSAKWSW